MKRVCAILLFCTLLLGCSASAFSFNPQEGKDFHDALWGQSYDEVYEKQKGMPLKYDDSTQRYSNLIYSQEDINGYKGQRQYIFYDRQLVSGCYSIPFIPEKGEKAVAFFNDITARYTQLYGAPSEQEENWTNEEDKQTLDIGSALGESKLFYYAIFNTPSSDIIVSLSGYDESIELYISFEPSSDFGEPDAVG